MRTRAYATWRIPARWIVATTCWAVSALIHAQSIERRATVPAGGYAGPGSSSLGWTVGQPSSATFAGDDLITAGVQQPDAVLLALNMRAFLDGPYREANSLMDDGLRASSLLPLLEPFTALGYTHAGGGGEQLQPSALTVAGPDALVDWVLIELRAPDGVTLMATRSAVVQRDGDVVDMDGESPVKLPALPSDYRIAIHHRNHLPVVTAAAIPLAQGLNSIDLTDGSVATYGTEAQRVRGSVRLLWAGDVTGDGIIKYVGEDNDRDPILQTIGGSVPTNTSTGYVPEDVNLDGVVKYVGEDNDRDPILQTVGGSVPTNTRTQQVP